MNSAKLSLIIVFLLQFVHKMLCFATRRNHEVNDGEVGGWCVDFSL